MFAISILKAKGVSAIAPGCGFLVYYTKLVQKLTKIPFMLSSVCQVPVVKMMVSSDCKIAILTANSKSFCLRKTLTQISQEDTQNIDDFVDKFVVVGFEDVPGFEAILKGTKCYQGKIPLIGKGVINRLTIVLQQNPNIGAIISECSMMGPYSNKIRKNFGLPVFDALTAADYLLSSVKQMKRLSQALL